MLCSVCDSRQPCRSMRSKVNSTIDDVILHLILAKRPRESGPEPTLDASIDNPLAVPLYLARHRARLRLSNSRLGAHVQRRIKEVDPLCPSPLCHERGVRDTARYLLCFCPHADPSILRARKICRRDLASTLSSLLRSSLVTSPMISLLLSPLVLSPPLTVSSSLLSAFVSSECCRPPLSLFFRPCSVSS